MRPFVLRRIIVYDQSIIEYNKAEEADTIMTTEHAFVSLSRSLSRFFGWRRLVFLTLLIGAPAFAQVRPVGQFKDWRVDMQQVGDDLVCFASTSAVDKAPKDVSHGDIHFFVSSWKSGAAVDQPSLKVGYDLRQELPPTAKIGSKSWRMYSSEREAFFEKDEKNVVASIKKGSRLRVEAISKRGTETVYHFSLRGSSAAIQQARTSCGK